MANLPNNGGTFVERVPGSPNEGFASDRSYATRIFDVPWAARQKAIQAILGYPKAQTAADGTKFVSRVTPAYHPDYLRTSDNRPFLYATKVSRAQDVGFRGKSAADVSQYELCRLTVEYESLSYDVLQDQEMHSQPVDESIWTRYVTIRGQPAAEYLTINSSNANSSGFKYVTGSLAGQFIVQGLGKIIPKINLQCTWHQLPQASIPGRAFNLTLNAAGAIETTMGCVNNATFNNYPKGTLLLLAAEVKPCLSPIGDRIFDVTYAIVYFEPVSGKGHNYIYSPKDSDWIEATTTGGTNAGVQADGISIYNWRDFSKLFKPA